MDIGIKYMYKAKLHVVINLVAIRTVGWSVRYKY